MVLVQGNISLACKIILVPILSFTFVFGTIGNFLVCIAILSNRSMKTATNGFILSLAIADLLVCLITVPVSLVSLFLSPRPGEVLLAGELALATVSCSLLQLAIISIDRYRGIVHPEKPRLTWKQVKYIIPPLWLLAIAEVCIVVFNWHDDIWFAITHFIWFWTVAIITVISYALIWRKIVIHNHEVGDTLGDVTLDRVAIERKTVKMIILVIGCLLVCWTPVATIYGIFIFTYSNKPVSDSMREPLNVLVALGYLNSCVNPFIYAIMNKSFRDSFRDILTNKCYCKRVTDTRKAFIQVAPTTIVMQSQALKTVQI